MYSFLGLVHQKTVALLSCGTFSKGRPKSIEPSMGLIAHRLVKWPTQSRLSKLSTLKRTWISMALSLFSEQWKWAGCLADYQVHGRNQSKRLSWPFVK